MGRDGDGCSTGASLWHAGHSVGLLPSAHPPRDPAAVPPPRCLFLPLCCFDAQRRRAARARAAGPAPRAGRALVVALLAAGARPVAAQADAPRAADTLAVAPAARVSRGHVAAEWLQAGAGPIPRPARPRRAGACARPFAGGPLAGAARARGGRRAGRPTTTAEGVTAGLAWGATAGPLTVRPGFAVLAGRAISTVDSGGYDWRGIAPPYLGQTGYQDRPRLTRGATVGAGLQLGADVALVRDLHLTGSLRQWTFSGDVIRANRSPFLAGVGRAVDRTRPARRAVRGDARSAARPSTRPSTSTAVAARQDTTR